MNIKKMACAGLMVVIVTFGVSPYASACASDKDLKIKVGDAKVKSTATQIAIGNDGARMIIGGVNEKGEQVETNVNGAVTTKKPCQNHTKNC